MVVAQSFGTSGEVTRYVFCIPQSGLSDHPAGRFVIKTEKWKAQHPGQLP